MSIQVTPLSQDHRFGVSITGLEPSHYADPNIQNMLRYLWIDKGLLLFREMEPDSDALIELSRLFGDLEVHPLKRVASHGTRPELVYPRFEPDSDESALYEVDGRKVGGALPWHSDLVYNNRINRGGILRALALPSEGGETGFIDKIEAYERLPQSLRDRIDGLFVIYNANLDQTEQRFGRPRQIRTIHLPDRLKQYSNSPDVFPRVLHPMVYTQKETGRKVLNVSPWFAVDIAGMENNSGRQLLAEVVEYCTDPAIAYYHTWNLSDMILWDNWRMLHCSTGVWTNETRLMERTTIAGDYELGLFESPDAVPHAAQLVSV